MVGKGITTLDFKIKNALILYCWTVNKISMFVWKVFLFILKPFRQEDSLTLTLRGHTEYGPCPYHVRQDLDVVGANKFKVPSV